MIFATDNPSTRKALVGAVESVSFFILIIPAVN
jgi:hypothetical protein